jgi:molybdopterin synthase catalytic subunit
MPAVRLAVVTEPLAAEVLAREVEAAGRATDAGCGAVATFTGVVRGTNRGRNVRYLEYEAYEPLALKSFEQIAAEIDGEWPGSALALVHRIGRLEIGEASVVIAVASAHRGGAFAACRYAIERVKQITPVWKHEFFEDGQSWVEGAVADPADQDARRVALERSCA